MAQLKMHLTKDDRHAGISEEGGRGLDGWELTGRVRMEMLGRWEGRKLSGCKGGSYVGRAELPTMAGGPSHKLVGLWHHLHNGP